MSPLGLRKSATWEDVEALVRELFELEDMRGISPEAYARRCIEEQIADAHMRRQLTGERHQRHKRRVTLHRH